MFGKSLRFFVCNVTVEDMREALTAINDNTLTTFHYFHERIENGVRDELANFLGKQAKLTDVRFEFPVGNLKDAKGLLYKTLRMQHLRILEYKLTTTQPFPLDSAILETLCEVVRSCPSLTVVDLSIGGYKYGWDSLLGLFKAVLEHEYLRSFCINGESGLFWFGVFSYSAETQYTNLLRSMYEKEPGFHMSKLVFIGDGGVGKSSTVRTLLGEAFTEYYESTVVLDLNKFAYMSLSTQSLNKVDTDHFVGYQSKVLLSRSLIKSEKPASRLNLEPSRFNFDFEKDVVDQILEDDHFHDFVRVPTKHNYALDHLFQVFDFGGQEVFYSLHHLLLTNSGIHVLVFDMMHTEESDMKNVRFWMESLLLNSPDSIVIIVGTHLESLREVSVSNGIKLSVLLQTVDEKLIKTHESSSGQLQIIKNERLSFFPIDNSNGPESGEAKPIVGAIVKAMKRSAGFDRSVLELHITGAQHLFMSNLLQTVTHMRYGKFVANAQQAGFRPAETEHMLGEYTKSGLVLYFPDVTPGGEASANIIAFSPKWLTSALAKVVFDKLLHNKSRHPPSSLRQDYQRYLKTAVLSKELLDFFWMEYYTEKEFLLECSLKMLVLVRFSYNDKEEYLVPSMLLKEPIDTLGVALNIPTEFHTAIYFTKYMSLGFFPRIVSIFIELAQCSESSSTPMLSGSFCRIILDANFVICLVVNQANNSVSICLETDQAGLPRLVRLTEDVIWRTKKSVYQTNIEAVGLALPAKPQGENRQPGVKITDLESFGNRRVYVDYFSQGVVDTTRFVNFQVPQVNRVKEHFDLFLSHAWGHGNETHRQVVRIEKILEAEGLKCWIDERYMKGHIDLDMLHGLECSSACILFLTDALIQRLLNENNNVTKEFYQILHDRNKGKPVFLVALESHLIERRKWPDQNPLRFNYRVGPIFDFSSEEAINRNIVDLEEAVQQNCDQKPPNCSIL